MASQPAEIDLSNTAILSLDYTDSSVDRGIYVLGESGLSVVPVANGPLVDFFLMSPARTRMAYLSSAGLVVVGGDLGQLAVIPLGFNEDAVWLDDNRLATYFTDESPIRMRVWDTSKGSSVGAEFELPGVWIPADTILTRWGAIFSGDLRLAAYAVGNPVAEAVALWDTQDAKILWQIDRWSPSTIRPAWDPQGTRLAVASVDEPRKLEVFLVDHAGNGVKWVDVHPDVPLDGALVDVIWSPNGRYVALIPIGGEPLFVLDTSTRTVVQYCIAADASSNDLIWSPDSTMVIVPRGYDASVLLTLADGTAYPLLEDPNLKPVAWSPLTE